MILVHHFPPTSQLHCTWRIDQIDQMATKGQADADFGEIDDALEHFGRPNETAEEGNLRFNEWVGRAAWPHCKDALSHSATASTRG